MEYYLVNIDFKNSNKTNLVIPIKKFNDARDWKILEISFQMSLIKDALLYIVYARLKKSGMNDKWDFNKYLKLFDAHIVYQMTKKAQIFTEIPDYGNIDFPKYVMTNEQIFDYQKRMKNIAAKYGVILVAAPVEPKIDLEDNLFFW